jgi:hypothetical protein
MHRSTAERGPTVAFLIAPALGLLLAPAVPATTIDTQPHPAWLLTGSPQFLVRDAWNGVALYRLGDLGRVHRFRTRSRLARFAVTPDEKLVLLVCDDGSISAGDLATGEACWDLSPSQTGMTRGYSVRCFSAGQSFVAWDAWANKFQALIFDSATGRHVGAVPSPPGQTGVQAVALCPGAAGGILVGADHRLYAFETASGRVTDTGVNIPRPVWHVVYAVDGKHMAILEGVDAQQLRIVTTGKDWHVLDVGTPVPVGHIKPAADGGYLLTAVDVKWDARGVARMPDSFGLRWRPGTNRLEELWRVRTCYVEPEPLDFLPDELIGVRTDFQLRTEVIDLRTGAVLGNVDNSANYRPAITSYTSFGVFDWVRRWLGLREEFNGNPLVGVAGVVGVVAVLWLFRRRYRQLARRRQAVQSPET